MGWAHCGNDKHGRSIGYGVVATCDAEGCDAVIDRGLSYVCGTGHGETQVDNHEGTAMVMTCGRYFCWAHRVCVVGFVDGRDQGIEVCSSCAAEIKKHIGDYQDWPRSFVPPEETS